MCSLTAYDLVVQVFSDYQMEIMSKHVVTQFGFADTQFNDNDDQLRSPPKVLVNIALPEDAEELSQQSDMFEQVCNERMHFRQKDDSDANDDDEVWLQRGNHSSALSMTTVRPESSSDEDETIADDANESMDIDSIDPWAGSDEVVSAAIDTGNPWDSASNEAAEDAADDNWANFSKADFSPFSNDAPANVNESLNSPASTENAISFPEINNSTIGVDQPTSSCSPTNEPVE